MKQLFKYNSLIKLKCQKFIFLIIKSIIYD